MSLTRLRGLAAPGLLGGGATLLRPKLRGDLLHDVLVVDQVPDLLLRLPADELLAPAAGDPVPGLFKPGEDLLLLQSSQAVPGLRGRMQGGGGRQHVLDHEIAGLGHDQIADTEALRKGFGEIEELLERQLLLDGEVGTVTRTSQAGLGVRLADGREISIDLAQYAALDYGYALTTYKSQGQTYDRVVVEADTRYAHLQDQRNSYVQITRARNEVKIYTDDREALREAAGILSVKYDTLDLKESLSQAVAMERRVRDQALGILPRQEAAVVTVRGEPQEEVWVSNQYLVATAGRSEILRSGVLEKMRKVEAELLSHRDLDLAEKRRVAEYLARKESVAIFDRYPQAEMVLAVALVKSGTRDLEAATTGFSGDYRKDSVRWFLDCEDGTKDRAIRAQRKLPGTRGAEPWARPFLRMAMDAISRAADPKTRTTPRPRLARLFELLQTPGFEQLPAIEQDFLIELVVCEEKGMVMTRRPPWDWNTVC